MSMDSGSTPIHAAAQKKLADLGGKKLVWSSYDTDDDRFYLFFEGMEAVCVETVIPVADGKVLAKKILDLHLNGAKHILALESLLKPTDAQEQPDEKAEEQTSGEGAESSSEEPVEQEPGVPDETPEGEASRGQD